MEAELKPGYRAEVDTIGQESWNSMLEGFGDANIYQTWAYESVISPERNVSRLVLKKGDEVVAAAQARIRRVPLVPLGVAYVRWGPMWRPKGKPEDLEVLRQALRAVRNEYAGRRKLAVRILPLLYQDHAEEYGPILSEEGFGRVNVQAVKRTLLIDLERSVADLRKGLDQKWRNRLNRAEKLGVEVVERVDDRAFEEFLSIYREMHGRKKFLETSDVRQFRTIQQGLPAPQKMKILIAYSEGKPAAGVVCSVIGDMGIYLYGGTSDSGLSSQASYLLQWKAMCSFKESGSKWYNLNGINPELNPGTYHFKAGLCGKNGRDLNYMGTFDTQRNLAGNFVWLASFTRDMYRKARCII